jgi:hypothetical protein
MSTSVGVGSFIGIGSFISERAANGSPNGGGSLARGVWRGGGSFGALCFGIGSVGRGFGSAGNDGCVTRGDGSVGEECVTGVSASSMSAYAVGGFAVSEDFGIVETVAASQSTSLSSSPRGGGTICCDGVFARDGAGGASNCCERVRDGAGGASNCCDGVFARDGTGGASSCCDGVFVRDGAGGASNCCDVLVRDGTGGGETAWCEPVVRGGIVTAGCDDVARDGTGGRVDDTSADEPRGATTGWDDVRDGIGGGELGRASGGIVVPRVGDAVRTRTCW